MKRFIENTMSLKCSPQAKGVWSTPPQNEAKFNQAYAESRNVLLIYSVKVIRNFALLVALENTIFRNQENFAVLPDFPQNLVEMGPRWLGPSHQDYQLRHWEEFSRLTGSPREISAFRRFHFAI